MNMRGMDIILLYSKNTKEFFDLMYDARTFEHRIVIIGSSKLFFFSHFCSLYLGPTQYNSFKCFIKQKNK